MRRRKGAGSTRNDPIPLRHRSRERPGISSSPGRFFYRFYRHPDRPEQPFDTRHPAPQASPPRRPGPRELLMKPFAIAAASALALSAAQASAQTPTPPRPDQLAFRALYKELVETDTS